jgi:hypothetical protein
MFTTFQKETKRGEKMLDELVMVLPESRETFEKANFLKVNIKEIICCLQVIYWVIKIVKELHS